MKLENMITNKTCNGKCSNCGECCSDILPIDQTEIKRIKKFIQKNGIKESKHLSIIDTRLDLTCPFRDNKNKKCLIYEVRPDICRCFICSKPTPNIEHDKALFYSQKTAQSMRNVFFGGQPLTDIFSTLIDKMEKANRKGENL